MKLLAVVLLLLPLSGCLAEVVPDFTVNCPLNRPQFFITVNNKVTPPTVFSDNNRYKQICQTLDNEAKFATLYDTENKIPVYSAYRFEGLKDCDRKSGDWYIEPQLDYPHLGGNMELEKNTQIHPQPNQALNKDYKGSKFHRGHLAPVYHANSQRCSEATFTLTNAAPQNPSFNSGKWRVTEGNIGKILDTYCIRKNQEVYVVTGVVPGNNEINNGVRIPSHYWMAYCCIDNTAQPVHSGGYIGENLKDETKEVKRMPVKDLETDLKNLYKGQLHIFESFILFGKSCYTENEDIVAEEITALRPKGKIKENQKLVGKSKKTTKVSYV